MAKIFLSICIATYNRAEYIGETLESIIPQLTDGVEVVIVDGASTDGTNNVISRYTEVCKQINYILLPSKGGVDQDFCKAVEYAKGEYCWLFPDDDLLRPNAIRAVLEEIPRNYSLIVVNAQVMNTDFSKIIENKRLPIRSNEVYSESEMEGLFKRAISYMSFIGAVVIKRDLWMQREKERYYGTEFIHAGVIFQAPLPSPSLVIAEPYITIRFGNAQWTARAMEVWMLKWPNLLFSFSHISEEVRQKYQMTNFLVRLTRTILCRGMGGYSLKEYQRWFASKDFSLGWKFLALLIAITPIGLVNAFLHIYRKIKKALYA
jgi:glycosyltransferase involved in cell wall biosynthesis